MWEKVIRKLRAGAMPPAGMPRPDAATRDALVSFLETTLDRRPRRIPIPAATCPHRLNRAEYANAIRDLLALDVDASTLLPPDDSADGFDNNADVLGVSPALLERYLSAAAKISALAVGSPQYRRRLGDVSHPRGCVADRPERGAAARHARRPDGARTRSRSTASTSSRSSCWRSTSARFAASSISISSRSPSTASACCWRRSAVPRTTRVVAQRDQRRQFARRAAAGAREGEGRPARRSARRFCRSRRRRAATGCSRSCAARSLRPTTSACRTSRT